MNRLNRAAIVIVVVIAVVGAPCRAAPVDIHGLSGFHSRLSRMGNSEDMPVSMAEYLRTKALGLVGIRYRYGGNTPQTGFDCSGFVKYVMHAATGLQLPRTATRMATEGWFVKWDQLRLGDLVFFNTHGKKYSHVGIYLGSGRFVHAPSSGGRVRVEDLRIPYWRDHYTGARRMLA